jgi:SAM-dependent methyltransferase
MPKMPDKPHVEPAEILPLAPPNMPNKLNLGCGYDIREGYLNVDLYERHGPELVADVTDLPMLPSGYFEEIVAQDVLEHLERHKTIPVLKEWARLLKPDGVIQIRVPSLMDLFEMMASPEWRSIDKTKEAIHLMYGTQAYTGDYHLAGFTARTLAHDLQQVGLLVSRAELVHGWLYEVSARKTELLRIPDEIAHNVYFTTLDRPGDAAGVNHYATLIASGDMNRSDVAEAMRQSDEGKFIAAHPLFLRRYMTRLNPVEPPAEPARPDFLARVRRLRPRLWFF